MIIDFGAMTRFQILRTLGEGGMGVVYEAFDRELNARVALKALTRAGPEAIARFKREFRSMQDLRHPNLISLGELFEIKGSWFFTMELVEGTDLLSWVRPGRPPALDADRLRATMAQLANGLAALHAAGKVHRDVKPSNVRVRPDGHTTLLDFGLVHEAGPELRLTGENVVGTTAYMAPEQAASGPIGPAADWYAYGAVLYEALAGRLPFEGTALEVMMAKQRAEPPPASSVAATAVPDDLDALATDLLCFAPENRPDAAEVLRRLGAVPAATTPPPATHSAAQGSPFVGRERELSLLRAAFDDARDGRPGVVVVRGDSGVGKSALVRRFAERLDAEVGDLLVLAGRCYERESVPYKALDGAIDGLARHLAGIDPVDAAAIVGADANLVSRLFPVLLQAPAVRKLAARGKELIWSQDLRQRAFAALRAVLARLAERQPLLLVIDDLQWADADSLLLLSALLGGAGAPQLLMVATARADSKLPRLADTVSEPRVIDLGGLPPEDAHALAARLAEFLGVELDAAAMARETDGHPMFLQELVRHAAAAGAAVRVRLEEALARRVEALEPPARRLLEALAVAGAPIPTRVAGAAAGLAPVDGARMAALLRVAMFARAASRRTDDRIEVYHDRLRVAVLERLAPAELVALHARIAEALEQDGHEDPRLLVFHLEACGQSRAAASLAERAAGLAVGALAFDQGAELYATALRLGEHEREQRRRLLELMGNALSASGRCVEAAEAFLAVVADGGGDPTAALDLRRRAAEQLLIAGELERGLAELRVVFASAGLKLPTTPAGAVASLMWGRLRLRLRGLGWKPRDPGDVTPRELQLLALQRSVAIGLSHVDYLRGADFNLRALLLALRTGQSSYIADGLFLLSTLRAAEGHQRRPVVDRLLGEARRIVDAADDPGLRERLLGASACCDYLMGDFVGALPKLQAADQALRELGGNAWQANNYRLFVIFALHYIGAYEQLATRLEQFEREARHGDRWMAASLAHGRNIVWLAQDQPDRVRDALTRVWMPPRTGFYQLQEWYTLLERCNLALHTRAAADAAGLREGLAAVERSPLMRLEIARSEHHWSCGRLAIVDGRLDEARRRARLLARDAVGHAQVRAKMLEAGVAPGREAFAAVVEAAEAHGQRFFALLARMRMGDGEAERTLRQLGVRTPERALLMLLPEHPG